MLVRYPHHMHSKPQLEKNMFATHGHVRYGLAKQDWLFQDHVDSVFVWPLFASMGKIHKAVDVS